MSDTNIRDYFLDMQDEMTAWRRELHRNPELSFEENWTSNYVADKLKSFGYEPHRGLGKTGVVATLSRGEGPRIGLRADMDALPIHEQTNLEFASKNPGVMHACGHDGHMTMLLAAAKHLAERQDIKGTIQFIFQPAEEGYAGARAMMEDGLFEKFPVDEVYALHNWPGLDEGVFAANPGPQMAAFDVCEIKLTGQGAHAAMPHLGQDVLTAAAAIHQQTQTIVARMIDPLETAVVSITEFHGGDAWNVLPGEARLAGCTRHFRASVQDRIEERMGDICAGVARSFGIDVELKYDRRYPATINSAAETQLALKAAGRASAGEAPREGIAPSMASEDFAFMLQEKPGCYLWLGAGSTEGGNTLHSASYRFNDAVLVPGAQWWVEVAQEALSSKRAA